MLDTHIANVLTQKFSFAPTPSQEKAIGALARFLTSSEQQKVMILKGYAGTGKTSLMKGFVEVLDEFKTPSVLMAPTGRAAKVLSGYVGKPAYTIHKIIYRQKSANDGLGSFDLNFNKNQDAVFIVDEASMISNNPNDGTAFGSGRLLDDVIKYVFMARNARLLIIGDTAQLPPVSVAESPALEKMMLEGYGLSVDECELTDVVRQDLESGILYNATKIRTQIDSEYDLDDFPQLQTTGFDDIQRISGEELIETLSTCQDQFGLEETLVVTRSNKRANLFNNGIRNSILYREEELTRGDYLLIVKNNYHWVKDYKEVDFIANGDLGEVVRINGYENLYDLRFADITLRLVDYDLEVDVKVILDVLNMETPGMPAKQQENFFYQVLEDYQYEKSAAKRYEGVKNNPHYNALQVKFGYAMTCHKAQGGQWKAVFVDQGYITEEHLGKSYLRWLYTAFTRATEKLYLVNFRDEFFNE
ncbi:ATP-dependent endonuclease [Marinilabiliaceae bacterium JC017]|nr:ATP-dependent endonuclease [Marinilabiliaceae bacterium JC017]